MSWSVAGKGDVNGDGELFSQITFTSMGLVLTCGEATRESFITFV